MEISLKKTFAGTGIWTNYRLTHVFLPSIAHVAENERFQEFSILRTSDLNGSKAALWADHVDADLNKGLEKNSF